ncbi:hypothetical protein HFQ13_09620 [Acidithiobacillus sp. VAN18-1]|uniref:Uncharacterized protein n=1 Tax=Igneacidithiobacillus copahuensis TaxID=2724909 RepID=A0AAE3CKG3_9PROT|nr:hypothetical protein [Igneacidithiobacillus copahuensis]MBU2788450.1 hypothetical protein [Igneacidithiobacillus copahuensis]MBU2796910.1 hypothetical protein [Acidithiobacillus sp. VAN18-2]
MATDARLNVGILQHPKIKKLGYRLGPQGPLSYIALILWVAANKPDGDLSGMEADDIELAIDWPEEPGVFFNALIEFRLLDETNPGHYAMHGWAERNPWVAGRGGRA